MNESSKLRFNISSWEQLSGCMSNNSRKLKIKVINLTSIPSLTCKLIQVHHLELGVLFACTVECTGQLISEDLADWKNELTTDEILKQLERFGFYITFKPKDHLKSDQLEYLKTLNQLGYDKIRIIYVYEYETNLNNPYVVAFNIEEHPEWLDLSVSCKYEDFLEAVGDGSCINVSAMTRKLCFRWDWLDFVANIKDVLSDNGIEI